MGWLFGRRKKSDAQLTQEQLQAQNPDLASPFDAAPQVAPTEVPAYGSRSFELQVDGVFMITGRGCVVTGTVASGVVSVGQQVSVAAQSGGVSGPYRVSGIEAFREQRDSAQAGDNVGLLLAELTREQVGQGDHVVG